MTVLPGMDELSSLLWIAEHHDSGKYDVIVVDAAPTGETVRLLSLPEAGRWWLERIFPIQRQAMRIAGPLLRRVMGVPGPRDAVFQAREGPFPRLHHLQHPLPHQNQGPIPPLPHPPKMGLQGAPRALT